MRLDLPVKKRAAGQPREEELARFFGYSHDVLAILDPVGRVLAISPSVTSLLGYPVDDLVGHRLVRWVHPGDEPGVRSEARTLLEGGPVLDLGVRLRSADGSWVPMRWSLAVGRDRRLYAVGRDHTHQAVHQQALLRNEMSELRLRTAMELHDGILQTLTGASLQIAVARRLVLSDPAQAEHVLETLGASVAAEQQEMRLYVDELKGRAPVWTDGSRALPERIGAVLERLGAIWGLNASLDARLDGRVGGELGRQVVRIVQEATVNAARHGGARSVSVSVSLDGSDISISIADDGKGFSFLGEYDHDALKAKRLGPLSLKHRVEETGGRISIHSKPTGSKVLVRVPLSRTERTG